MNISVHTRSRRWLLLLVVGAAAGLLAACGSSSSSTTSAASASSSGGQGGSRTTVAACLRRHGVTIPANAGAAGPSNGAPAGAPPSGGGPGAPPSGFSAGGANGAKLQAALKACGANVPGRGQVPKISRQSLQKYVSCVRQHGYRLPNPNFSGKGAVFPASVRGDKKFQGASRACQSLLSRAQPGTPAGA